MLSTSSNALSGCGTLRGHAEGHPTPHATLPGQLTLGFEEDPLAIRAALETFIRAVEPSARLIPELGVRQGAGRIDLAAVGRELAAGIKGARDSLTRLPRQAEMFSKVFERLTLVAPERHLTAAERWVPDWWGLMVVADGALSTVRASRPNPTRDPMAIAELLWKDEAIAIVEQQLGRRMRGTRRMLWQHLVNSATSEELSTFVRMTLRQRPGWRAVA